MSLTTSAFSSLEVTALERHVDIRKDESETINEIWSKDNMQKCCEWIDKNNYKRVCLQFPDCYLDYSKVISDGIKDYISTCTSGLGFNIFVLADTSYGSCCVDEIAAMHVNADSIVHFGNACRSKIARMPVLYLFPQMHLDLTSFQEHLISLIPDICDKDIWIFLDIGYHHRLEEIKILKEFLSSKLHVETYPLTESFQALIEPSERIIIFVGDDNKNFYNLSLTNKAERWFIYNAICKTMIEKNPLASNYMRRRYYYIEKCKDARTLGLIVATLTSEGYLQIVSRIQEMAKCRGIKTQIISVGRINPAKLANFLEIDCFVLIGCYYNNLYNSKEYYKPIVSVFEAEMALNTSWHMKYPESYVTDFKQLLPNGKYYLQFNSSDIQTQDISLISGQLRHLPFDADNVETENSSTISEEKQKHLQSKKNMEIMTKNSGNSFEDRTWKGLDPMLGMNTPSPLEKGLTGIPIKYSSE